MNDVGPAGSHNYGERRGEVDLRELLAIFGDRWRWIAGFWVIAVLATAFYALTTTPIYRTNALIQVEEKNSGMSALGDLTSVLAGKTQTEAEREIIRSRAVLGAAIERESLHIEVRPVYFPFIGEALARRHDPLDGPAKPPLGLKSFAWGGERIQIDRLDIPRDLQGQELTLSARSKNEFELLLEENVLLKGKVGEAADGRGTSVFVAELIARPETRFRLVRHNRLSALGRLKAGLSVAEVGRQTGILELTLDGASPDQIAATLNAIASIYLRQNVERTSEDAAKTLTFLDAQLPELKKQLDAAEAALNQYRVTQGSIDLSLEAQSLLEQMAEVERQISELELKQAELGQRFTAEHPVMAAVQQQRSELSTIRSTMQAQIRQVPEAERFSLRLMRDVQVANELYMLLLNRAQELKVVRAGTVGNVRIIDEAFVPLRPIKPKKALLLMFGSVLGVMLGMIFIVIREALNPAIRDPDELEKIGGLPVYAIIPHSEQEQSLNAKLSERSSTGQLLVTAKSDDAAVESLRSLRTSLEFLLIDIEPKIVTVTGPAPGAGKSFVTANLAALFLQAGKKALLVDADLRKGHLHRLFSLARQPGLVEVISCQQTIDDAIRRVIAEGLDFISTGEIPPNPSELITSSQFEKVLTELGQRYDIVLMDAPPVLGAAESAALARLSTINLLVVRSEQQTPREVELALTMLRQAGANPKGFVLNDLQSSRRHSYAGYHYYRYHKE
ncbi:MAG: polysaccharide biosynthesis tyrosine autokinase [Gammaproteobacteria bacterium]|nr:polysaccharide biosynthesis tyrosine autokinase [Gammaproteobacteria bacterium]MDH3767168.1 polysaccharide biosynthesis tyrosine autokinase [Gammaproteobacteria bacterium]